MFVQIQEFFTWPEAARSGPWKHQIAAGISLVLAGILVAVYPRILILLLAAVICAVGVALILTGWRQRPHQPRGQRAQVTEQERWEPRWSWRSW